LEQANARQPNDREVLFGLVAFHRDRGDLAAARRYAEKLSALSPQDPAVQQLVDQLKGQ
jgi:Tfp pilus assembly protein PilF